MLAKLHLVGEILRILRHGENLGDVAALKLQLYNSEPEHPPFVDEVRKLEDLTFAPFDLLSLGTLPKNSLGSAYGAFLSRNKLKPFVFSSRYRALYQTYPISLRYARIHDIVHTLTGFETDVAGERGVYAFVYKQNYSEVLNKAFFRSRTASRILKPFAGEKLQAAEERGFRLAENAKNLITIPFEELLDKDLTDLRKDLIPAFAGDSKGGLSPRLLIQDNKDH